MNKKSIVILDRGFELDPEIRKIFPTQIIEQLHITDLDEESFIHALFDLTHFSGRSDFDWATIISCCSEEQIRLFEQAHEDNIVIELNYTNVKIVDWLIQDLKKLAKLDSDDWKWLDLEFALMHRIRRVVYRSYCRQ